MVWNLFEEGGALRKTYTSIAETFGYQRKNQSTPPVSRHVIEDQYREDQYKAAARFLKKAWDQGINVESPSQEEVKTAQKVMETMMWEKELGGEGVATEAALIFEKMKKYKICKPYDYCFEFQKFVEDCKSVCDAQGMEFDVDATPDYIQVVEDKLQTEATM